MARNHPDHSVEDIGDDGLEAHLNGVHNHRLNDLMGTSHDEQTAMHAAEHTAVVTDETVALLHAFTAEVMDIGLNRFYAADRATRDSYIREFLAGR